MPNTSGNRGANRLGPIGPYPVFVDARRTVFPARGG